MVAAAKNPTTKICSLCRNRRMDSRHRQMRRVECHRLETIWRTAAGVINSTRRKLERRTSWQHAVDKSHNVPGLHTWYLHELSAALALCSLTFTELALDDGRNCLPSSPAQFDNVLSKHQHPRMLPLRLTTNLTVGVHAPFDSCQSTRTEKDL